MSTKALNSVLALVMAVAIALNFAAARDFSKPNLEVMPDMYHGPTYHAFERNEVIDGGSTLRDPPMGSIARGFMPFDYVLTEEDALRAGEELINPFPADNLQSVARGAEAYSIYCQHCHGASGAGDGMVSKRGFPPPPSLLIEHAVKMKDGQMYHVTTLGQGNMPAHSAQVSREDRWHIINHVRALQSEAPAASMAEPTTTLPAETPAEGAQP